MVPDNKAMETQRSVASHRGAISERRALPNSASNMYQRVGPIKDDEAILNVHS